jgi:hypothetical protein
MGRLSEGKKEVEEPDFSPADLAAVDRVWQLRETEGEGKPAGDKAGGRVAQPKATARKSK